MRFNWLTLSYRYKIVDTYFGVFFYTLEMTGERPLIKAKKVILKNDYIHHVIDVYHI